MDERGWPTSTNKNAFPNKQRPTCASTAVAFTLLPRNPTAENSNALSMNKLISKGDVRRHARSASVLR